MCSNFLVFFRRRTCLRKKRKNLLQLCPPKGKLSFVAFVCVCMFDNGATFFTFSHQHASRGTGWKLTRVGLDFALASRPPIRLLLQQCVLADDANGDVKINIWISCRPGFAPFCLTLKILNELVQRWLSDKRTKFHGTSFYPLKKVGSTSQKKFTSARGTYGERKLKVQARKCYARELKNQWPETSKKSMIKWLENGTFSFPFSLANRKVSFIAHSSLTTWLKSFLMKNRFGSPYNVQFPSIFHHKPKKVVDLSC